MTFGFAMLFVGSLLLFAGTRNRGITDVLRGITSPLPGPGESGFISDIAGSASSLATGAAAIIPGGMARVDGKPVCAWVARELQKARANGWSGTVTSGYRSAAKQAEVCATGVTPCAAPGESNHQGRAYPSCAVDVTDAEGLAAALPANSPLKWTGRTANDPVHFSSGKRGV